MKSIGQDWLYGEGSAWMRFGESGLFEDTQFSLSIIPKSMYLYSDGIAI